MKLRIIPPIKVFLLCLFLVLYFDSCWEKEQPKIYVFEIIYQDGQIDTLRYISSGTNLFRLRFGDKNGIKGSYRAISKKYLPFYLVEYEWKFNHRNFKGNELDAFLKNAVTHEKELLYWKATSTQEVKEVAYGK